MAHHGQRGALRTPEADRHALPQRARARAHRPRLRHREDPRRRALRDRRGVAGHDRGVLDAARRDRGGDGRAQPRRLRGQSPACRARGADDPRRQARRRPQRTQGRLGEAGSRSGVRCPGTGCRGPTRGSWVEDRRAGHTGPGSGGGTGHVEGRIACRRAGCSRFGRPGNSGHGRVSSGSVTGPGS